MQTVIRTTPTPERYMRYPDSYNDLKELLHAGWKVVLCNKIGNDLEYILERGEIENESTSGLERR